MELLCYSTHTAGILLNVSLFWSASVFEISDRPAYSLCAVED